MQAVTSSTKEDSLSSNWLKMLATAPRVTSPENPSVVYNNGKEEVEELFAKGIISEGDRILDLGCGIGRLAVHLAGRNVTYIGIDPLEQCIQFAQQTFKKYPNCTFHHMSVQNSCYELVGEDSASVTLPFDDASFDVVLAVSLFTHFESGAECQRYMSEIHRVLRNGGSSYSTWFRATPNHPNWDGWRTVIMEAEILNFFTGFRFVRSWGGHTKDYHDQWRIHAKKVSSLPINFKQIFRNIHSLFHFKRIS
jgi:ubiquinone/menaquinone biosynthesis C-methylase UbiE